MTSANCRRAALTLHALAAADREWLLRQMGEAKQQTLRQHLEELQTLGIVADTALVDAALEPSPSERESSSERSEEQPDTADPWQELEVLPAVALMTALRSEPAGLIARVLAQRTWPWQTRLLESLPVDQRLQVELQLECGLVSGAALDRFLLDALLERARLDPMNRPAASTTDRPASSRARWFGRWRQRQ